MHLGHEESFDVVIELQTLNRDKTGVKKPVLVVWIEAAVACLLFIRRFRHDFRNFSIRNCSLFLVADIVCLSDAPRPSARHGCTVL